MNNILEALEELIKQETGAANKFVGVMYDEEDGFFLTSIRDKRSGPVKDLDEDAKRTSLQEAITAAIDWHNEKASGRFSIFSKIELKEK